MTKRGLLAFALALRVVLAVHMAPPAPDAAPAGLSRLWIDLET
jgi:hypothetical protein